MIRSWPVCCPTLKDRRSCAKHTKQFRPRIDSVKQESLCISIWLARGAARRIFGIRNWIRLRPQFDVLRGLNLRMFSVVCHMSWFSTAQWPDTPHVVLDDIMSERSKSIRVLPGAILDRSGTFQRFLARWEIKMFVTQSCVTYSLQSAFIFSLVD